MSVSAFARPATDEAPFIAALAEHNEPTTQSASSSLSSSLPSKLSLSPSAPRSLSPQPSQPRSPSLPTSSHVDGVVSSASQPSSSPSPASSVAPSLLSIPFDGSDAKRSLSDRIVRSPRSASKAIGARWRSSAAAKQRSEEEDAAGVKDEQQQRLREVGGESDKESLAAGNSGVKEETSEDQAQSAGGSLVSVEDDKRASMRATLNVSEMRRRREASDTGHVALPSHKRAATKSEPVQPPPPPPRLLLRASSRGVAQSSTAPSSVTASPPTAQSPSSSSASSPSSSSHPPGLSRMMSRTSTRNLFASLSKSVALFSSNQTHGQAEEDEENREWLMRRLSKQDEPVEQSSSSESAESSPAADSNASWLSAHSYVFTFLRERVFPSLLVLLVLIQLIVLPLRLALSLEFRAVNWRLYDQLLDVLYVVGVLWVDYLEVVHVGGETEQKADGESIRADRAGTGTTSVRLRSSLSRRMFVFDILSTLPYYLFVPSTSLKSLFADPTHATATRLDSLLRLPRILRAPRLSSFLDQLELFNLVQSIISPAIFRLLSFAVWMYLFAHFAGCAWWLTSYLEGLPDDEWVVQADMREGSLSLMYLHLLFVGFKCVRRITQHEPASLVRSAAIKPHSAHSRGMLAVVSYRRCLLCCAAQMTGGAPNPSTTLEHIFTLIVSLIGLSIYGLLVGSLTSIISNMNSKQDDFRSKMEQITALMESNHLPADVQTRVKSCMRYLYGYGSQESNGSGDRHRGNEGWEVLDVLPAYLRNELLCYVNGDIMRKVPLFRDCSDGFMRSLVPLLTPEVVPISHQIAVHSQCQHHHVFTVPVAHSQLFLLLSRRLYLATSSYERAR